MGKEIYLHDMVATRAEYWFKPPAFVTAFLQENLNDPRDMEIAWWGCTGRIQLAHSLKAPGLVAALETAI